MAPIDTEYELVYQGICAVAARCDGARSEDGVGFNGQDTHFGRRIASVPFSEWTDDVKADAARVANTYQVQILSYTGIDVTTLQVVKDAKDAGTNYRARDDARGYERKAKGASKVALRKVDVVDGDVLAIFFDRKDPEFGALLDACRALPGRKFDPRNKCWTTPVTDAFADFILTWDFPITPAAEALIAAPQAEFYNITLAPNGQKLVIETEYNPNLVDAIKVLPGRAWVSASKVNTVDPHPRVLKLVEDFHLSIHPDARAACDNAVHALEAQEAALLVEEDLRVIMAHVSRQQDPNSLPAAFIDMLEGVLAS